MTTPVEFQLQKPNCTSPGTPRLRRRPLVCEAGPMGTVARTARSRSHCGGLSSAGHRPGGRGRPCRCTQRHRPATAPVHNQRAPPPPSSPPCGSGLAPLRSPWPLLKGRHGAPARPYETAPSVAVCANELGDDWCGPREQRVRERCAVNPDNDICTCHCVRHRAEAYLASADEAIAAATASLKNACSTHPERCRAAQTPARAPAWPSHKAAGYGPAAPEHKQNDGARPASSSCRPHARRSAHSHAARSSGPVGHGTSSKPASAASGAAQTVALRPGSEAAEYHRAHRGRRCAAPGRRDRLASGRDPTRARPRTSLGSRQERLDRCAGLGRSRLRERATTAAAASAAAGVEDRREPEQPLPASGGRSRSASGIAPAVSFSSSSSAAATARRLSFIKWKKLLSKYGTMNRADRTVRLHDAGRRRRPARDDRERRRVANRALRASMNRRAADVVAPAARGAAR